MSGCQRQPLSRHASCPPQPALLPQSLLCRQLLAGWEEASYIPAPGPEALAAAQAFLPAPLGSTWVLLQQLKLGLPRLQGSVSPPQPPGICVSRRPLTQGLHQGHRSRLHAHPSPQGVLQAHCLPLPAELLELGPPGATGNPVHLHEARCRLMASATPGAQRVRPQARLNLGSQTTVRAWSEQVSPSPCSPRPPTQPCAHCPHLWPPHGRGETALMLLAC